MGGVQHASRPMRFKHGAMLRIEFVPEGRDTGAKDKDGRFLNPIEKIYFKVLPSGEADVSGILISFPVLDAANGLGLQISPTTHYLKRHDIHVPRMEFRWRDQRLLQLRAWCASGVYDDDPEVGETLSLLRDGGVRPMAHYNAGKFN